MLAPLVAVPVLAVVGIPQFAPVIASSPDEDLRSERSTGSERTATSPRRTNQTADDLFAPLEEPVQGFHDPLAQTANDARPMPSWNREPRAAVDQAPESVPVDALDGWDLVDVASPATAKPSIPAVSEPPVEKFRSRPQPQEPDHFVDAAMQPKRAAHNRGFADEVEAARPRAGLSETKLSTPAWAADPTETPRAPDVASRESVEPKAKRRSFGLNPGKLFGGRSRETEARAQTEDAPELDEAAFAGSQADEVAFDNATPTGRPGSAWQAAARRLKELGVGNHHLNYFADRDAYRFWCSVNDRSSPTVTRRFEAMESDPLTAIENVLRQVEDYNSARPSERRVASEARNPFGS
ncbi:MAG TPA: hypothetical protein VHB77_01000 [Planctomycetaceae bacterium]|nr:hypothetical protein [Planctomycetaceae bacterium]